MDNRKPYGIDEDCDLFYELRIISFKCRICKKKCEIGEQIVKCINQSELDKFHRGMENEFPDG